MYEASVRIGEAAALYGLTPSTLRWWEKQGVLRPPNRDSGRRQYRDEDLRRIGLAYLCCVTGGMVLDDVATITSGSIGLRSWQRAVRDQVERLERQMETLESAHAYLSGLLECPDDDIAQQCPYLDAELIAHTPRGRARHMGLVEAARAAMKRAEWRAGRPSSTPLDGAPASDSAPENTKPTCKSCAQPLVRLSRGRPRKYCSHACQQRAYRARQEKRRGSQQIGVCPGQGV
ncbi:hypothetical protein ALI144C_32045 [Actinosynnema sp. ALI-1.44]|uniref:MerR family transcriptional regulator n=1 Tax=Actinosynnema sp. ALI-1.44 TaxID=1933779 RepID=UPI00097CAC25|nr:MerR family transcriptional regulator [Actinosynnema sp. ALI-1.44]ONI78021.1 hypothetical protein ALI144C_32045 [Actinosynnema sp. ALI-1.44]